MLVSIPIGETIVVRNIPNDLDEVGNVVTPELSDGEALNLDITEDGDDVACSLYFGNSGLRLYEVNSSTGDVLLADTDMDEFCPAGSSVVYEVWTGVGSDPRVRARGILRRRVSLSTENPAMTPPPAWTETPHELHLIEGIDLPYVENLIPLLSSPGYGDLAFTILAPLPADAAIPIGTDDLTIAGGPRSAGFVVRVTDEIGRTADLFVSLDVVALLGEPMTFDDDLMTFGGEIMTFSGA